jgi:hypothetical protein
VRERFELQGRRKGALTRSRPRLRHRFAPSATALNAAVVGGFRVNGFSFADVVIESSRSVDPAA